MPHIILEYSESLASTQDVPKLLTLLHKNLASQETVDIHGIKSRAVPVQYTIVGDGKDRDQMFHVTLRLLPGRSDELRAKMAADLRETLKSHIHDDRIAVTAEVVELDAVSYQK